MKQYFYISIIAVICSGCFSQKKAIRQLEKIKFHHPELIVPTSDTIVQIKERLEYIVQPGDTLYGKWKWDLKDIFEEVVTDSVAETTVTLEVDSLTNNPALPQHIPERIKVKVKTIVHHDTIELTRTDTIYQVSSGVELVTKVENKIPWWIYFVFGILIAVIVWLLVLD